MRFIHAADLHLDSPLSGLRDRAGDRADDIAGASRRAFDNLVAFAIAEAVDLVVIAGDVFDGDWADYNSGLFLVRGLERLNRAGIPVVLIRGNHDAANQMSRRLSWPPNVRELSSRAPETVLYEHLGIAVHGQSFPNRAVAENLVPAYPAPQAGLFNIGVLHTSADGRSGHDPYAPCSLRDLTLKGYDYWALGHVHTREVLSTDPWIVFPGNLQGRHVNEPGAKGFTLVTVAGGRVSSVEHVPVDVVRWATLRIDVSGSPTLDELCPRIGEAIDAAVADAEGRTLAVRLVLSGACAAHVSLAGDPERLAAECASLALRARGDVWVERVEVQTRAEAVGDEGALGDVLALIERVRTDAGEIDEIRVAVERSLDKVPAAIREEAELATLSPERWDRIMAGAEAMILHRLSAGSVRS
ncbi:metallophosphoesterase family protein [Salinarimonas soli]|uniref:DNA repair exonuclease n=1 Tax=Salinarimonas soli TaxID=1638099 RepID=A0A5B2VQV5_9HYPH|nr:DNA repair exonuclease [Salinarimonas soli]KAA2241174.1 DNA repair exonuclease [Salinarimonas soli]